MLSYELCKQLEDAGFPQILGRFYYNDGKLNYGGSFRTKDFVYCPTFDELIEACGDEFQSLERYKNGWFVFGKTKMYMNDSLEFPDEAVAKLWLALNKK